MIWYRGVDLLGLERMLETYSNKLAGYFDESSMKVAPGANIVMILQGEHRTNDE